jgi:PKHD-type hydroxylase
MFLAITGILTAPEVATLHQGAAGLTFADGKATAGRIARQVKANDQAAPSPARDAILAKAKAAILAHPVFAAAARPRAMTPLLLSRYRTGQTYGLHVDDALMGGLRTDLSFTLFLSDPASYDGGALVVEDNFAPREVKLAAGDLILYPSTSLHRVTPVTRGERLAIVGWVESWIRGAAEREILFDLDQALATIEAAEGKSPVYDKIAKTRSNLLRLWAGL